MKVLFACTAADGHFLPLVPLARAFAARGDDVVFATSSFYAERVESTGFASLPAGLTVDELNRRFAPYRAKLEELPFDERRHFAFSWRFGRISAAAKFAELLGVATDWQPDLIVHESADLAAPIVAAALDVPSAHHSFGRTIPRAVLELAARETETLWRDAGLEQDALGGVYRGVYVNNWPSSLEDEPAPPGVRVEPIRPTSPTASAGPHALVAQLPDRPTVYVTLGTVFNDIATFRIVLEALADFDCNVVVTVGRNNDPKELAPIPANAIVERYIPQADLLPYCTVAVGHGGAGSTLGALAHGVPLLFLPQAADQFANAEACRAADVARVVRPDRLSVQTVRAEITALLDDPSYATAARAVAAEIASMPAPAEVAERLTNGASATRPPS
jgi:UDP:flavonoid glycosyltransferase YjiC (YdhE family)